MNPIDERTAQLIGEENAGSLHEKHVAIFGIGGVGGTAFEALLRSGVGHLSIIDKDQVEIHNVNRQILFGENDVGAQKTLVAFLHAKTVRDDIEILPESYRVNEETLNEHDYSNCDFIIDAIDDIAAKVALIRYAINKNIPFVISLGMGNRLDPSQVRLVRLDKTEGDPLAKKLRERCRKEGIDLKRVMAVCSLETPFVKKTTPSSMMMVPSAAGLLLASYAIKTMLKI